MKDGSWIDNIQQRFILLTVTSIYHGMSVWNAVKFWVPPEFGSGDGAQHTYVSRNIHHKVRNAYTDVFHRLSADYHSFSAEFQAERIDIIYSTMYRRIYPTGTDTAMAQSNNNEGSIDKGFLDSILEELVEQLGNSVNHQSSAVAATEGCVQFSVVLLIRGSAITSSIEPNPCSNSHSNDITNIIRVESTEIVDGSPIGHCVILLEC
jgi:hypothetical protein